MEESHHQPRARVWAYWLGLALLSLVLLELALRLMGFLWAFQWKRANTAQDGIRIMAIGESTTAEGYGGDQNAWPEQLQRMLQAKGVAAQVSNHARVGTTSNEILSHIRAWLEKEKPHIVIAMMGVNDRPNLWLNEIGLIGPSLPFLNLRLLKLFRLLLSRPRTSHPSRHFPISSLDYPDWPALIQELQAPRNESAKAKVEAYLKNKSPSEASQFYGFLAQKLTPAWGLPDADISLAHSYYRKTLEKNLGVEEHAGDFALIANQLRRPEDCRWLAERFVSENETPSLIAFSRLVECLRKDLSVLHTIAREFESEFSIRPEMVDRPTARNYQLLQEILQARGICLIAMQYPLQPTSMLEQDFPKRKGVLFAGNEANFKQALDSHPREEIFLDNFAGDFGHTTKYGHRLLAESALEGVLRLLGEGRGKELRCD